MTNLLYIPKIWIKEQSSRGAYPSSFTGADSIRFDVDITGNQDVVIVENPSSFIKYLDAIGVNSTTVELKLKKVLSTEFLSSAIFKSMLKSAGIMYDSQNNKYFLSENPSPVYLSVLLDIDGVKFAVKDSRVKELVFSQEKGKAPYLEAVITGWIEPYFSSAPYAPLEESSYLTSLYISQKVNYWNSLELSLKNDVYEQVDLQTGKKYFELVKNESELNIDYDIGVLVSWQNLIGAGAVFNNLVIKASSGNFTISINGVLKEPAVPKDRRGIISHDIKIAIKSLEISGI